MKDKISEVTSTISSAKTATRTILAPKDSLTYQNCQELETMFNDNIRQNKTEIILNCKAVAFLDSEALELLLRFHEELRNRGGRLKIAALNTVCRDILVATRLIGVLNIYEDIHRAVKGAS